MMADTSGRSCGRPHKELSLHSGCNKKIEIIVQVLVSDAFLRTFLMGYLEPFE
jgi:hypothetical protein